MGDGMVQYMKRGAAFYRDVLRLAVPLVLQYLLTSSLAMVDNLMVGQLGELPLAAVAVANLPIFVIQLIIFGFQSGSSVLMSQYWGKGERESISRVMGICSYAAGGIAVLFALVMLFFAPQLMGLLSNDDAAVSLAADYARIVGPSYVLASLSGVYIGAQRSMENPGFGLKLLAVSMLSNTFLNWVFIFGHLGAPAMGVEGAALGTFSARVLEFGIMLVYALKNRHFRIDWDKFRKPGRDYLAKFFHYSLPVVMNETLWGIGYSMYRVVMGHMENSTTILASRAIAGNVEDICTVAIFGLAASASIVIGREIGAGRRDTVYEVGAAINTLAGMVGILMGIVTTLVALFFLPNVVYPYLTLTAESTDIITMMLLFTAALMPLRAFSSTNLVGVLRGGGDVNVAMRIDIGPMWLVALPLAALFGLVLEWGILWVYIGISMDNIVKFGFGLWRFRTRAWVNDVTVGRDAT